MTRTQIVRDGYMQFLELTPEQYDEFDKKRMDLSRFTPGGGIDRSAFLQWAIETYGLEVDQEYHIRVKRP